MKIGTMVEVTTDTGGKLVTFTRSNPWRLADGSEVVLLRGTTGGWSVDRCRPIPNDPNLIPEEHQEWWFGADRTKYSVIRGVDGIYLKMPSGQIVRPDVLGLSQIEIEPHHPENCGCHECLPIDDPYRRGDV